LCGKGTSYYPKFTLFDPTKAEALGMIKLEDIDMIAEQLEPNSSAAVMLFENLWAIKFK
jgi:hypothetical protein